MDMLQSLDDISKPFFGTKTSVSPHITDKRADGKMEQKDIEARQQNAQPLFFLRGLR